MKNFHEKFPDNGDENYEYLKILNEIVNETTTDVLMGLIDSEDDAIFQYLIELGWTPPVHCDADADSEDDDQQ